MNSTIENLTKKYTQKELPQMNPGDTVKVFVRIVEGGKERTQAFEGIINSPRIEKINVLRRGDVRRAKLYYLRDRIGKATRIKEKIEKR